MTLDYAARVTLTDLQERYGAPAYQDVPDAAGEDDGHRLRLRIDAACRVVSVTVLDLDGLRTAGAVSSALVGAFEDADTERAVASITASGSYDDYLRAGEALLRGEAHVRTDPAELRARRGSPRPLGQLDRFPDAPRLGLSDNGYLQVQVEASGRPLGLEVDAEWLLAASEARLEDALRQAFQQADGVTS